MRDPDALPAFGHDRPPDAMLQAEPRQLIVVRAEDVIRVVLFRHEPVTRDPAGNSRTEFRQRMPREGLKS
jgi:hypothetical protein